MQFLVSSSKMQTSPMARRMLEQEALALLTRLDQVQPFALHMPMVAAAAVPASAQRAIDRYLARGRRQLRTLVGNYVQWLNGFWGRAAGPVEAQRQFTVLRMRFQRVLTQLDIFADALTQRSEHGYGVWQAGLDALAADALRLPDRYYHPPPIVTYLDRGVGAAIRRVRTRLPGGGDNPVALIRVPRERMIGSGIGSSLVHEVGHQAAALLDLNRSFRLALRAQRAIDPNHTSVWTYWERTSSEIIADFWSIAKLGVGSILGLMGVVSLPRPFVFRIRLDDPHPFPWIRVKLAAAIGNALFPHPQWKRLAGLWEAFYPTEGLDAGRRRTVAVLEAHFQHFVPLLINHRPALLRGRSLQEALAVDARQPKQLVAMFDAWRRTPKRMLSTPPVLALATLGQAKADGRIGPEDESRLVDELLQTWALQTSLGEDVARIASRSPQVRLLPAQGHDQ